MANNVNFLNQKQLEISQSLSDNKTAPSNNCDAENSISSMIIENDEKYFYQFPKNSVIKINTKEVINISSINIDLSDIFIGGINYGGGASKLMARTMNVIGNGEFVYNLPFCIEGCLLLPDGFNKLEIISTEDKAASASTINDIIKKTVETGFTHIHIPINLDGHASLVAIILQKDTAFLRFYDSLSPNILSYEKRYTKKLENFIKSLLPSSISLTENKFEILHVLDQGDGNSTGCGYYTLYTALLLTENEEVRNLEASQDAFLFDKTHDKKIRAELVVRSLLHYGIDNVDTSFEVLITQRRNHIFDRINFQVKKLIKQLRPRLEKETQI